MSQPSIEQRDGPPAGGRGAGRGAWTRSAVARWSLLGLGLGASACRQAGPWVPVDLGTRPTAARATGQEEERTSGAPLLLGSLEQTTPEAVRALSEGPLELADVLRSVEAEFPVVAAALLEVELADAQLQSSRGGFDTRIQGGGKAEVLGDFESQRADLALVQPLRTGGIDLLGGYQIGIGDLASYDGDNETNDGGEVRLGASLPLLRGRAIDKRRVAEWKAELALERATPLIVAKRLEAGLKGAEAYWRWVAAGQQVAVVQELLELSETRQAQIESTVDKGQLPRIANTENEQNIVSRRSALIKAERELQDAAVRLSLFLRDAEGNPIVVPRELLPETIPEPESPDRALLGTVDDALRLRPELRILELERARLILDRDLARNTLLPQLDMGLLAAQDLGPTDKVPDTRDDFELEVLVKLLAPLQNREARGLTREAKVKLAKLELDLQFARDSIAADVAAARIQFEQAFLQLEQVRRSVELARTLAEAERTSLRLGQSDLFRVNLREQAAGQAQIQLVGVLFACQRALAKYRAVLGLPYDEFAPEREREPAPDGTAPGDAPGPEQP